MSITTNSINEFQAATRRDNEVMIAIQDPIYKRNHAMAVKNYNR